MPTLSINFGRSETTFLIYEGPSNQKVYTYPYSFDFTNCGIAQELLTVVSKETKENFSSFDKVITGFPYAGCGEISPKLSMTLDKLASRLEPFFPVFVSNYSVITGDAYASSGSLSLLKADDSNILPNLSMYPFLVPDDSLAQFSIDNLIRFYPANLIKNTYSKPIIFSGDRVGSHFAKDALTYMLMIDLIKIPGFHILKIDEDNVLANLLMLTQLGDEYREVITNWSFKDLGVLINSDSNVECLMETDEGTRQFFEVPEDQLFLVPMDPEVRSRIIIKSDKLGSVEKHVNGGTLGLIIDTRPKNDPEKFTSEYVQRNFKEWLPRIREVLMEL